MSAAYDAIDAVRWSRLKVLRLSAKHYQHALSNDIGDSPALRIGRCAHGFILEPHTFDRAFVCFDGERRGNVWKEFSAAHQGRQILTLTEWERAMQIGIAIQTDPHASEFLRAGLREATVTWTDRETDIRCKARVDHAGVYLVDLKTTGIIEPWRFASHAARMGYHGQLAFYADGLAANGITVDPEPVMIAAQNEPPYDVITYRLPMHVTDAGRLEYRKLLKVLKRCQEAGRWPGLGEDVRTFELPAWAVADELELLTMGGVPMDF